jgi:hypothetical protein
VYRGLSLWHLHMCLQYILVRSTPSIILPHPSLLRIISMSQCSTFIHIQSISTIFVLLHPLHVPSSLPLMPTPGQDLFYLPVLRVFKGILIIQGVFALVFHTCILYFQNCTCSFANVIWAFFCGSTSGLSICPTENVLFLQFFFVLINVVTE